MTIKSGFFNSSGGDRRYDAMDLSSIFDGVITDGVFATIGKIFAVKPGSGLQVTVDTGKAWFNHTWTVNDAVLPLTISAADVTLDRIDAVVLEVNTTDSVRKNTIKVVKGSPSSSPTPPKMTNTTDIHQYPLAYVTVKKGATSISTSNIEITVGRDPCPFVTGPLKTVPIDSLFAQWEDEFDYWFNNVKSTLEGDTAANLQRQIDEIKDADTPGSIQFKIDALEKNAGRQIYDEALGKFVRVRSTISTLRARYTDGAVWQQENIPPESGQGCYVTHDHIVFTTTYISSSGWDAVMRTYDRETMHLLKTASMNLNQTGAYAHVFPTFGNPNFVKLGGGNTFSICNIVTGVGVKIGTRYSGTPFSTDNYVGFLYAFDNQVMVYWGGHDDKYADRSITLLNSTGYARLLGISGNNVYIGVIPQSSLKTTTVYRISLNATNATKTMITRLDTLVGDTIRLTDGRYYGLCGNNDNTEFGRIIFNAETEFIEYKPYRMDGISNTVWRLFSVQDYIGSYSGRLYFYNTNSAMLAEIDRETLEPIGATALMINMRDNVFSPIHSEIEFKEGVIPVGGYMMDVTTLELSPIVSGYDLESGASNPNMVLRRMMLKTYANLSEISFTEMPFLIGVTGLLSDTTKRLIYAPGFNTQLKGVID